MNSARIRTIASWLPTLDEARLREVEDFVLAKAIEQQDSAPARADVSHGNPQAGGGTFCQGGGTVDAPRIDPSVPNNGRRDTGAPRLAESVGRAGSNPAPDTAPSHPSNGSQRVGGGTCSKCGGGLPCWLAECPVRDSRIESGLRELAAAKPQVAAPGVAEDYELWSAEMVDGRFDGSDE